MTDNTPTDTDDTTDERDGIKIRDTTPEGERIIVLYPATGEYLLRGVRDDDDDAIPPSEVPTAAREEYAKNAAERYTNQ